MQQQEHLIKSLETIITDLQLQIQALQKPQLMYRPPHSDEYIKVTDYLDSVDERLRKLEKDSHTAPRTNHGERLTKLEAAVAALESHSHDAPAGDTSGDHEMLINLEQTLRDSGVI